MGDIESPKLNSLGNSPTGSLVNALETIDYKHWITRNKEAVKPNSDKGIPLDR